MGVGFASRGVTPRAAYPRGAPARRIVSDAHSCLLRSRDAMSASQEAAQFLDHLDLRPPPPPPPPRADDYDRDDDERKQASMGHVHGVPPHCCAAGFQGDDAAERAAGTSWVLLSGEVHA